MGEPLAMLPPRCRRGALAAGKAQPQLAQGGTSATRAFAGVFQRDGGADPEPALAAL